MSVSEIIETPEGNGTGWFITLLSFIASIWSYIMDHNNEILFAISGISGVLGLLFLVLKIRLIILEYKIKKKEYDNGNQK